MSSFDLSENEVYLVKCAVQFFFRHIRFDDSTVARMSTNEIFHLFDERRYHASSSAVLHDSLYETTETHIAAFVLSILHQGLFSTSSLIGGIIYLSRLKEATRISLHTYSWRLLFLTTLLIADKCLEEKPIRNSSLCKLFPVVTPSELGRLEMEFVVQMNFKLFIRPELFNSFVDKLMNERSISRQIDQMVHNSDFVSQFILPNMKTLTHTPELLPSQSTTPITILRSTGYSIVREERSQTRLNRVLSSSSFIDKSYIPPSNFNITTRRRAPSAERRSPSVGRSRDEPSSMEHSRFMIPLVSDKKYTYPITSLTKHRRSPVISKWNNTF